MSLIYTFSFDTKYAGRPVQVFAQDGTEVAGSPFTLNSTGDLSTSLTEGTYTAKVSNPAVYAGDGYSVVGGVLDTPASIEAGSGGVGASETAYLVATGPVYATDDSGTATLVFEADSRHAGLPDWCSVVGGNPTMSDDAGAVAGSFTGVIDVDFSGTTPPTASGSFYAAFGLALDGTDLANPSEQNTPGNGQDTQTLNPVRAGYLISGTTVTVTAAPGAEDGGGIPDGVATPRVALTLTRIAQAAVLPEA